MPYDEEVDARVRRAIAPWNLERMKMFGGTGYLLSGNMVCGVHRNLVILRLDGEAASELLGHPHVSSFDMTGRPMNGWLQVPASELDEQTLKGYLKKCYAYASSLPAKSATKKRKGGR